MLKTYKILSILLSYPNEEVHDFLQEVVGTLEEENLLSNEYIAVLKNFTDTFIQTDLMSWQEQYVQLFDYNHAVSLHLFEHVHGDSKDRGPAMVDLMSFYGESGYDVTKGTLPDFIPAFLEYLSMQTPERASELLCEPLDIFGLILHKLKKRESNYQSIFEAIISLSGQDPNDVMIRKLLEKEPNLSMDEAYEEVPVSFGTSACDQCKI